MHVVVSNTVTGSAKVKVPLDEIVFGCRFQSVNKSDSKLLSSNFVRVGSKQWLYDGSNFHPSFVFQKSCKSVPMHVPSNVTNKM